MVADIYGIKFELDREHLSSVEIGPLYRFFERDQELELRILHCDATTQTAELTNCYTITATGVAPSTEQGDTARFLHADRFPTFKIYNEIESDFLPLTT